MKKSKQHRRHQHRVATPLKRSLARFIRRVGHPVLGVAEFVTLAFALAIALPEVWPSIPKAKPELQVTLACLALAMYWTKRRLERHR
jgi:hypothetical protein